MKEFYLKFDKEFIITTTVLRMNRISPLVKRNISSKIQIVFTYILCLSCFVSLLHSIITADFPQKNYIEVIKNGIIVNAAVTVLFKYSLLIYNQDSIVTIIESIDEDYEKAKYLSTDEQSVILAYSKRGKRICQIWLIISTYSCLIFPVKAFFLMLRSYYRGEFELVPMFDLVYPQFINDYKYHPALYSLLFLWTFIFDVFVSYIYVCFDPLVPIFILHACSQLHLIRQQILKVFLKESHPNEAKENLKQINKKLASVYRFIERVQNIFGVIYELNLKTTTILIPFTAIIVYESLVKHKINFEFIIFFIGSILHFYIPCYYSDLLMDASELTRQAIYSCNWENTAVTKNRRMILFMLTRTSAPLVIRTVFFPLCLDTFSQMARQAYAIYNILNAAWL